MCVHARRLHAPSTRTLIVHELTRYHLADGMLIYRLLGPEVEKSFTRSWGISYAMDTARQWKDLVHEMFKAALVMLILERLYLTRNTQWLENYVDYMSVQALQFSSSAKATFYRTTNVMFQYHRRLRD